MIGGDQVKNQKLIEAKKQAKELRAKADEIHYAAYTDKELRSMKHLGIIAEVATVLGLLFIGCVLGTLLVGNYNIPVGLSLKSFVAGAVFIAIVFTGISAFFAIALLAIMLGLKDVKREQRRREA